MKIGNNLASMVDYTNLKADARSREIRQLCLEARQYGAFAVCVLPCHIPLAVSVLKGAPVKIVTVAGFPLGGNATEIKASEARQAARQGADEIDMVANLSAFKSGEMDYVRREIEEVKKSCGRTLKVIIETGLLNETEISEISILAMESGAHFIKTSTGLGPRGASVQDIRIIKETVKDRLLIKASGSIRTRRQAEELIAAGANRIGTSSLQVFA